MATLYWVSSGGPGYFSDGNNWSLTSGGSPAGVAPTSSDSVVFDSNSTNTCTIDISITVVNFSFVGLCQNVVFTTAFPSTTYYWTITGNLDLSGGYFLTSQTFATLSNVQIEMTPASGTTTYATMSTNGVYDLRINGASSTGVVELSGQSGSSAAKVRTVYLTQGQLKLSSSWAASGIFYFGDTSLYPTSVGGFNANSNLNRSLYCAVDVQIYCFGDFSFGGFTNFSFSLTNRSKITFMGAAAYCTLAFPKTFSATALPIIENRLGYSPDYGGVVGPAGPRNVVIAGSSSPSTAPSFSSTTYVKCEPQSGAGSSYTRGVLFPANGTFTFSGSALSFGEKPLDINGSSSTERVRLGSSDSYQANLAFTGSAAALTTNLVYDDVSYIESVAPYKIVALLANGNVDNGNNTNVIFENTGTGFLGFFF